ncbi:hypothetical protein LINPERHAP1_LOCUS36655 [Linum perenne]
MACVTYGSSNSMALYSKSTLKHIKQMNNEVYK